MVSVPGSQGGESKTWRCRTASGNNLYLGKAGMKGVRGQEAL